MTSIIAMTTIIGFSVLDQYAHADPVTISDQTSCESILGSVWDGNNLTCTITTDQTITDYNFAWTVSGVTLVINSDVTITMGDSSSGASITMLSGTFINNGIISSNIIQINAGTFINNGTFTNNNLFINNDGTVLNNNVFINNGWVINNNDFTNSCEGVINGNSFTFTQEAPCDSSPPVITLNGEQVVELLLGESYDDAGAIVTDNDPNYTGIVTTGGDIVDTATPGTYTITYDATPDAAGNNPEQVTRTVIVLSAEDSIDKIAQDLNDAITNGDIGNEGASLLAKLNQIIDRLNNNNINTNATCNQLESFILQLEGVIINGSPEEINAVQPMLDAANGIQASYC